MKKIVCVLAAVTTLVSVASAAAPDAGEASAGSNDGCIAPASPADGAALPAVRDLGSARVITGGIGVAEASAMRAVQPEYALALTFLQHFGDKHRFLSAVQVEFHNAEGRPIFCATSDGPYMFVDLPPGEYRVSATTDGGRRLARTATVIAGVHRDLTFVWPASASAH